MTWRMSDRAVTGTQDCMMPFLRLLALFSGIRRVAVSTERGRCENVSESQHTVVGSNRY